MKEINSIYGFDYYFKLDEKNPSYYNIHNPTIRYNLLRYGSIYFLDAMKRQMHEFYWPYIALMLNSQEMKTVMCSKAIVTSDDIDTYIWIQDDQYQILD